MEDSQMATRFTTTLRCQHCGEKIAMVVWNKTVIEKTATDCAQTLMVNAEVWCSNCFATIWAIT